jgi:hypothetical protein
MPRMPAIAIRAAAFTPGRPRRANIGATTAPAVRTDALELPVIMPGNIVTRVRRMRRIDGKRLKRLMTHVEMASRAPEARTAFMKTIAVAIVRIVST